tara:strand:+ start:5501 stop:5851 length:351 start_codon:yes stop_codon:yes gene_type:complete
MAYNKEYYETNKDKFNKKSKEYYEKNKDNLLSKLKDKRKERTEDEVVLDKAKRRDYYEKNRDNFLTYASEQYKKDRTRIKEMEEKIKIYERTALDKEVPTPTSKIHSSEDGEGREM